MNNDFVKPVPFKKFKTLEPQEGEFRLTSFDLEITARCNNDCRHCYINLPVGDVRALDAELTPAQIGRIADQAAVLGSLWCLITGGEPLVRPDFGDIFLDLKKKGFLVSVFTNACLLTDEHIRLFRSYPPRHIEVTVYGITQETYDRVTRRPGSYVAFRRGLDRLLSSGLEVRLKAVALRSNYSELSAIADFCRKHTKDYFRFDPLLHLRFDGNEARNSDIIAERLSAEEIVRLERADSERTAAMIKNCQHLILTSQGHSDCRHLFHCAAGKDSFVVSPDGHLHLCPSLRHNDCVADLATIPLEEAWRGLAARIHSMTSSAPAFLDKCRMCPIINLCLWCPAHAHLETGRLDGWSDYFCKVAHARANALQEVIMKENSLGR